MLRLLSLSLVVLGLAGCASLNSVSITQVPANRSNQVSAESQRWVILGLNFDNDFVDTVSRDLGAKCPGGRISGILTKDEIYDYFIMLVYKRHVVATGYCEKHGNMAARSMPNKSRRINSVDESAKPETEPEQEQ